MVDQALMDYFKFDMADLNANQHGQFTEKQKSRIFTEDKSSRTWSRLGGFGLMFIGAIGFAGAVAGWIADSDWGFRIGFGIGFGVIWPLIWGGIGAALVKSSFSKHEFKLAKVQGRVNIVRRESYSSEHHTTSIYHELHIGGQEFNVQEDMADVLMQGDEYILYYIADSSEILSAERAG
jgi:MFS family permease